MAFNLGAGLSAMGKSVSQSAALYILENQRSALDMQRVQLADSLASARESRGRQEEAEISMGLINQKAAMDQETTLTPEEAEAAGFAKGTVAQRGGSGKISVLQQPQRAERITAESDIGKLADDFKAGRITQAEYTEAKARLARKDDGSGTPMAVYDPETGEETYVRPADAVGKKKRPPRDGAGSPAAVVAPIFAKIAEQGEGSLTAGERAALARYEKLSLAQIIGRTITSGPEFGGTGGAAAVPAVEEDDPGLPTSQRTPAAPAKKADASQPKGSIPLPPEVAKAKEGALIEGEGGKRYRRRGQFLVPEG